MPVGLETMRSKVTTGLVVERSTEFGVMVNETNVGWVGTSACETSVENDVSAMNTAKAENKVNLFLLGAITGGPYHPNIDGNLRMGG